MLAPDDRPIHRLVSSLFVSSSYHLGEAVSLEIICRHGLTLSIEIPFAGTSTTLVESQKQYVIPILLASRHNPYGPILPADQI